MTPTNVHIINHTHWDREWFMTSIYTSRWIPGLIDKLDQLVDQNPAYRFLFDGQTLVIEDLLAVAPDYAPRIEALVAGGHLTIGPYYCQPDWQLTGGELLIRNLVYGQQDLARFGGTMHTGWLVDTFGHISQAPQIHRLFGIDAVYVWRGVPRLEPYFFWQGADGSQLLTIDLFGGYRNLYGVTHAPEVAVRASAWQKWRSYSLTTRRRISHSSTATIWRTTPKTRCASMPRQEDLDPELALRESTPALFAAGNWQPRRLRCPCLPAN